MKESTKTNQYRSADFFAKYFAGSVLDIGCGDDPVVPHARPFDVEHGNAECILDYFPPESFDTVNSSHCLEHMRDVPRALSGWWALVRPGGYMILIIPHEDLYEQGFWPSLYNRDHKATFRIGGGASWSPVSYSLTDLVSNLDNAFIVNLGIQDNGFHYDWLPPIGSASSLSAGKRTLSRLRHSLLKRLPRPYWDSVAGWINRLLARIGVPTDQTHIGALAQIQCILQKRN